MLVLKIVCLELCPVSLTRSGCNCKQLLWAQSSHMGDLPLSHFSARQSFMYFLLYSLDKLHLKIVWAFASFTLWLSLMTSPDYLVVKCKIIFQKGSVPQNVQHHCLLQHPYSVCICILCMCLGWILSSHWCLLKFIPLMSHPPLPWYSCVWCHTQRRREKHALKSDHTISDIGKGQTCQSIKHLCSSATAGWNLAWLCLPTLQWNLSAFHNGPANNYP